MSEHKTASTEERVSQEKDPNYLKGLAGEWLDFPEDYPDVTRFMGGEAQERARELNEELRRARDAYRKGLLGFLQTHGILGQEAENITSAAGVDGFKLALAGEKLPVESYVDYTKFIGDYAQQQAKKINWCVSQRGAGYAIGSKVAHQTTAPKLSS